MSGETFLHWWSRGGRKVFQFASRRFSFGGRKKPAESGNQLVSKKDLCNFSGCPVFIPLSSKGKYRHSELAHFLLFLEFTLACQSWNGFAKTSRTPE